LQLKQTEK